jgi:hypothetical protein
MNMIDNNGEWNIVDSSGGNCGALQRVTIGGNTMVSLHPSKEDTRGRQTVFAELIRYSLCETRSVGSNDSDCTGICARDTDR